MASITNTECYICCEKYNRAQNTVITCENMECQFTACKSCVRQYLLTTISEANCMQCKTVFTEQFIIHNLNRSFLSGDYKKHRVSVLLDKAISQLPDTMPDAMRHKDLQDTYSEMKLVRDAIKSLKYQENTLKERARKIMDPEENEEEESRKFVMACVRDNCRGFLSTSYKCGLCEYYTCSACLKVKEEEHDCIPEDVETASLIKSQTKPCPSCGERISKIDGCDQMWCVSCHNAFSWRTGQVDNGIVHNPHFFQYQRSMNAELDEDGPLTRRGHGQCNTELMPDYLMVMQIAKRLQRTGQPESINAAQNLTDIYEFMAHMEYHEYPVLRRKVAILEDTKPLRIRYILGKTEKKQLSENLYANEKKHRYTVLIHDVMNLMNQVGLETLWGIVNTPEENIAEFVCLIDRECAKFKELCAYCNKEWLIISMDFRISVPWIMFHADHTPACITINWLPIHNEFRKIYPTPQHHTRDNYSLFVYSKF